jgi:hypothetical protein
MGMTPPGRPPLERASRGRWRQFTAQLRRPVSLGIPLATFAGVAITDNLGDGVRAGLFVLGIVVVWAAIRAPRRAREAFYESYAEQRGLTHERLHELPAMTPLLERGSARYAERSMSGSLPGGLPGVLAHYAYEEHWSTGDGAESSATTHPYTVVLHSRADVAARVGRLYCEPRAALDPTGARTAAAAGLRPLALESVAFDVRYQLLLGPGDDDLWVRRLYTPSFIVWLAEEPPPGFGFECVGGDLCVYVPSHYDSAVGLDALCRCASVVAQRLAEEAAA